MFPQHRTAQFVCFLYTLHNRLLFRVYNETELLGFVRGKGISSADLCICFARFYEKKHGVVLGTSDTLSAFYLFHRIMRNQSDCYYAQRLLVVSRYGLQYARSLAANIRTSYSREIKTVAVREFCEVLEDDFLNYDLLITDVDSRRLGEFVSYSLPMVQTEFLLGTQNCPELDLYLERLRQETERKRIGSSSFFRTDFYGREDVFAWLEKRFEQSGMDGGRLVAQLRQNTGYLNLERQNRIVLLPVLGEGVGDSMPITVMINRTAFVWEEQNSQIFVCYARSHSWEENQVLNAILRRFVHMSVETAEKLIYCPQLEPMQILYPDISPEGL